jgi:hypothetical protein
MQGLRSLAATNRRVRAFQDAYPHEDSSQYDAQDIWNSYPSRHYDSNGALIDDTVELHKQFMSTHPSPAANTPADNTAPASGPASNSAASPVPSDTPTSDAKLDGGAGRTRLSH